MKYGADRCEVENKHKYSPLSRWRHGVVNPDYVMYLVNLK